MAPQAQVGSIQAIESFRASLILFLSKARPTLEEVSGDVLRTKLWLENDQRDYWKKEMKIRSRELERAQSELFTARLSKLQDATAAQEMALHRAQRAIREAQAKEALLKKWNRDLENRVDPLVRQVDALHGFLTTEMGQAIVYLTEIIRALEAYAGLGPGTSSLRTAPSPDMPPVEEENRHQG